MTAIARRAGDYVCGMFARCYCTVVAATAGCGDAVVVKDRILPTAGGVAIITDVAATEMSGVFACCSCTVMAAKAGAAHFCMVYAGCRLPSGCSVAALTEVSGGYVAG